MKYELNHLNQAIELANGIVVEKSVEVKILSDANEPLQTKTYGVMDKETLFELKRVYPEMQMVGFYFMNFAITDYKDFFEWEDDQLINFYAKNCFFDGLSDFSRTKYGKSKFSIIQSYFGEGRVNFQNCTFDVDVVNLHNLKCFKGDLDFSYSQFYGKEVNLYGTEFNEGQVEFKACNFTQARVSFSGASLDKGDLSFDYTQLSPNGLDLSGVNFGDGDVSFRNTNFGDGDIILFGTTYGKGKMSFSGATMGNGNLDFSMSYYKNCHITFRYTIFGLGQVNMSNMTLEEGNIRFKANEFKGKVLNFSESSIDTLSFMNCLFVEHVNMGLKQCQYLTVDNCIIEKTFNLSSSKGKTVDIKTMSVLNTKNLGQIDIDWTINNVKQMIYSQNEATTYRQKANQFRILKENFRNIGQYNDEDFAYVEFKRCETISAIKDPLLQPDKYPLFSKIDRWITFAFKWFVLDFVGNYATNPFRIIAAMFYTIFVFFGIYTLPFIEIHGDKALFASADTPALQVISKAIYHSVATIFTIGYGDVNPGNIIAMVLSGLEGFIGLFLMSYFTVAFVRKILR